MASGMRSRAWISSKALISAFASPSSDLLIDALVLSSASASSLSIGSTSAILLWVPIRLDAAVEFREVMRIDLFRVWGRKLSSGFFWLMFVLVCAVSPVSSSAEKKTLSSSALLSIMSHRPFLLS
jgi:hypothetical protein